MITKLIDAMRTNPLWLALLIGCGPALTEQIKLRSLVDTAATSCKAAVVKCPTALVCAQTVSAAENAIQLAQVARSQGITDSAKEASAAGAYAAAIASCAVGGWK